MQLQPLLRLHRPDRSTFLAHSHQPLIVEGLTSEWPSQEKWNLDFFAQQPLEVEVRREAQRSKRKRRLSLAEYVHYVRTTQDESPYYLASWHFPSSWCADYQLPDYWQEDYLVQLPEAIRPRLLWLFIGPPGTGFPLHLDVGHTAAWNVQLQGRKAWIAVAPESSAKVYDGEADLFRPDFQRFPDLHEVRGWECVLEPGEAIYLPSLCWHQTRILETSVALSGNYCSAQNLDTVLARLDFEADQGMSERGQMASALRNLAKPSP